MSGMLSTQRGCVSQHASSWGRGHFPSVSIVCPELWGGVSGLQIKDCIWLRGCIFLLLVALSFVIIFFFFWLSHSLTHEYSCAYLTGRDYCSLKPTWECPEVVVCLRMQFTGLMDTDGWGPHSLLLPFPEDL